MTCDVCDGPIISLGEANVTCPRAHHHCVCVDCQRRMFGEPYVGRRIDPGGEVPLTGQHFQPTGGGWRRVWWLKIRRCPADVTDADRALWALATPEPTFDEIPF